MTNPLAILPQVEQLPLIQGKNPDSVQEVWVAQSLYKYHEPFVFQYAMLGGTDMRGGLVIDFLLTRFNVPLEVYGEYWHEDELPGRDIIRVAKMRDMFGMEPLILWGSEAKTEQDVLNWVRRNAIQ